MSRITTARRIALLSSSSLGLAAIVSAVSLGVAATPGAAVAQTATCVAVPPPAGNGGDDVVIAAGDYEPGITCDYVGEGAVVSTAGAITVSETAPGGGIDLLGVGAADIAWDSSAGTVTGGPETNGPVIGAVTAGDIDISTAGILVDAAGGDGIRAQSTGAGNITVLVAGGFNRVSSGEAAGAAAIRTLSAGGDIDITTDLVIGTNFNSNQAGAAVDHDGIVATTTGAGAIDLDLNEMVAGYGPGGAAVRISNGTGDVYINNADEIRGGADIFFNPDAQSAAGIAIDSGGDIVIDNTGAILGAINNGAEQAPAIIASGQTFTLNLTGNPNTYVDDIHEYQATLGGYFTSAGFFLGATGDLDGSGESRYMAGQVDLSGITDGATFNFNSRSRWSLEGNSVMSPGDDVVNLDPTSIVVTTWETSDVAALVDDVGQEYIQPGVVDFGDGDDTFNARGRLLIAPAYSSTSGVGTAPDLPPLPNARFGLRGEVRLLNLETFNNSGAIWLGPMLFTGENHNITATDRWHDDMLAMPGAVFHGEEGSRVIMDVDLNKSQAACERDDEGYMPAADCLDIKGGAATGRTELSIVELIPGDRGIYNPGGIVLVDLAGGDPAQTDPGAFVLSADTPRYVDIGNGAIEKGVFVYVLGFDGDAQQFKLYGLQSSGAQQFPMIATAANQLWRTASGGWFDRRVRQRDVNRGEGLGTGAWFNVTGVGATRDIATVMALGTGEVEFDNSYEQTDVAASFGWDLINHRNDTGSWALGGMVGYAQSQVDFDDADNSANLEGVHAGVYGGYSAGGFFLDAAVSGAWLSMHNDVPAMALAPAGTLLDTNVRALGGRVEAGWRWRSGALSVEPLVGLSTVSTEFDEMRVPNDDPDATRPGVTVQLDAADSRRASAGVRVGLDELWADVAPTSLSLTARALNEFEGGSAVSIANVGPTALSADVFDGTFTQLTGSVGVSNVSQTVSGYLNVDTVIGDDYESLGVSAGLRLQW